MIKPLLFIIGALVAGRASACCDTVSFDSTGLLAESENAVIIGTYEYVPDGSYYNPQNGLYLYYYPSRGVSMYCIIPWCTITYGRGW